MSSSWKTLVPRQMENPTEESATPLLDDVVRFEVDYRGRPAPPTAPAPADGDPHYSLYAWRLRRGLHIMVLINSNLISNLTGALGQSTATATAAVNVIAWTGAASLLPLLGAFVADSYGLYRTIIIASLLYILGLGFLTFTAVFPFSNVVNCQHALNTAGACSSCLQVVVFFFALYLVAAAQGHKPCGLAFEADQFDMHDPKEQKERSSFFNWWYFGMTAIWLLSLS